MRLKRDVPGYTSWMNMKARCFNPKGRGYNEYGRVGISVCEGLQSFEGFYELLGDRPKKHSIDRIDGSKGYTCGICAQCQREGLAKNVRWATNLVQALNRKIKSTNRTGVKGVYLSPNGYRPFYSVNGKAVYVGVFKTLEEAVKVRKSAEDRIYKELLK